MANDGTQEPSTGDEVTSLLKAMAGGDSQAAEVLFPLVYGELHRLASAYMRTERQDHTLQTTALIHEAYLNLVQPKESPRQFQDMDHFVATAAIAMRHILVNHAKARRSQKRGGDRSPSRLDEMQLDRTQLDAVTPRFNDRAIDLIALDEALSELAELDPVQHQIVELRFFGGLTVAQCAAFLDMSERRVYYEWSHARAWLRSRIEAE